MAVETNDKAVQAISLKSCALELAQFSNGLAAEIIDCVSESIDALDTAKAETADVDKIATDVSAVKNEISTALNNLKTAINAKGGSLSEGSTMQDCVSAVEAIELGVDTSDATASAADMLSGKTAYVGGEKISGSMPDNGEIDVSVSTGFSTVPPKITIPNGYTAGGSVDLTPVLDGLNTVVGAGYSNGGFAEFHSNSLSIKNTLINNINKLGLHTSSGGTLTLSKNSSFASCASALYAAEAPKPGGFYTSIPITISTTTQTVSTGLSSVSNIAVYYSGTYPAPGGTYSAKGMVYAEGTKIVYASSSDVIKVESISGGDITFKFTLPAYSSGAVVDYTIKIFAH